MTDESINPPTASNNSLAPALSYFGNKARIKFNGSCLKQDKITFIPGKTVNIYIVYETKLWNYVDSSDPTLGNFLFGAIELVKDTGVDKYKYLDMVLELIQKNFLHFLLVYLVKMY